MRNDLKITKEEHIWTSEEKIKFCGHGEWVEEVDLLEFEYLDYRARICRIFIREPFAEKEAYFGAHLCGYVQIPKTHPYFNQKEIDLDCHGGITFNEAHEEHWVGFDCGHSGDIIPTSEYFKNTNPKLKDLRKSFPLPHGFEKHPLFNPIYRNMKFCITECINIIKQLIDIDVTALIKL